MRRDELIPRETFRPGDRIRAYLFDVRREARGPQIFLSRTHPQFMAKLFAPGSAGDLRRHRRGEGGGARSGLARQDRRDLARFVHRSRSAPASACAARASRRWSASSAARRSTSSRGRYDRATFIVNALQPAEVVKVVLDEEAERIEVVVPDEQLSLAIGRRGQNVRLASQLTGWDIDILTEAEESERRQKEFLERTETLHGRARRRRGRRPAARLRRLPHRRGARAASSRRARRRSRASTRTRRPRSSAAPRTTSTGSRPSRTRAASELGVAGRAAARSTASRPPCWSRSARTT